MIFVGPLTYDGRWDLANNGRCIVRALFAPRGMLIVSYTSNWSPLNTLSTFLIFVLVLFAQQTSSTTRLEFVCILPGLSKVGDLSPGRTHNRTAAVGGRPGNESNPTNLVYSDV